MAMVNFQKMTEVKFKTITPDAGSFYWVTREGGKQDLYFGTQRLNNIEDIKDAIDALSAAGGAIDDIKDTLDTILGDENTEGSIKEEIKKAIDELADIAKDGKAESVKVKDDAENFTGVDKDGVIDKNLEVILAEIVQKIKNAQNAGKLIIVDENSDDSSDVSKIVTFYQGEQTEENKIYTLNILGGMFDVTGDVITIEPDAEDIPDGLEAGKTYIKLVIGAGSEPVYISADELVSNLTGGKNDQTTVDVNNTTNEITVTINENAIINSMIKDGTIAKTKLAQSVQDTLDKADSAIQSVTEGEVDGAINVDGKSVNVHGLADVATSGSAADIVYKPATEADDESNIPAKPEITVADALAKIEEALGQGGDIAQQISKAISDLNLGTASQKDVEDFDIAGAANEVLGTEEDTSDKTTVYGVRAAINEIQTSLVWNEIE